MIVTRGLGRNQNADVLLITTSGLGRVILVAPPLAIRPVKPRLKLPSAVSVSIRNLEPKNPRVSAGSAVSTNLKNLDLQSTLSQPKLNNRLSAPVGKTQKIKSGETKNSQVSSPSKTEGVLHSGVEGSRLASGSVKNQSVKSANASEGEFE